ncbi:MAG: hydroxymethylbilane synthase [Verrucomicrobia bacterium]|nr:hydroxymethylbilane synthase [Verrucomicrobiota bacterium]
MSKPQIIRLATRGSPLALAQATTVLAQLRSAFPERSFELRLIKTTGDKLQKASMANPAASLPKGLFTKELEVALLAGEATLAVHSLKDLPTELPAGLELGAVLPRSDARDVLVYRSAGTQVGRGYPPATTLAALAPKAVIATSSTRRREQLLATRPDLTVVEIRGNVGTRLNKVASLAELDATLLAAAGLGRLGFLLGDDGVLSGPTADAVPPGLLAVALSTEEMIPAVGQAAIGIECRSDDLVARELCARLNHAETFLAVTAERSFLRAMGGGCQSPVAAHAVIRDGRLILRGVSFRHGPARHAAVQGGPEEAVALGEALARQLEG